MPLVASAQQGNLFLERELSQDVERIESSHCEGGWELVLPLRNI